MQGRFEKNWERWSGGSCECGTCLMGFGRSFSLSLLKYLLFFNRRSDLLTSPGIFSIMEVSFYCKDSSSYSPKLNSSLFIVDDSLSWQQFKIGAPSWQPQALGGDVERLIRSSRVPCFYSTFSLKILCSLGSWN